MTDQAEALRNRIASMVHSARMGVDECDAAADRILAALTPPATTSGGLDERRIADAFHDALCPVSHHDRREVYAAAMRETQPCRVKYDDIAARLTKPEEPHD